MKHADLTAKTLSVPEHIKAAAKAVYDKGGSPRAQIDAAREVAPTPITYVPHVGAKQIAKALRRAAKP